MKNLNNQLNANNNCLSVHKFEVVLFKLQTKHTDSDLCLKLMGSGSIHRFSKVLRNHN